MNLRYILVASILMLANMNVALAASSTSAKELNCRKPSSRIMAKDCRRNWFQAVKDRDLAEIERLVDEQGMDINLARQGNEPGSSFAYANTALQGATLEGDFKMMEFLISKGADLEALSFPWEPEPTRTAIFYAAHNIEATKLLYRAGARINFCTRIHGTPLYNAERALPESAEVVNFLRQAGAISIPAFECP